MILLVVFAFVAGIVTILSPCILPVLPIVLSGGLGGGKRRPVGIVVGFVASFTFFTLFLTAIVKLLGISADTLRLFSILVIGLFGVSLLIPKFQVVMEKSFSTLSRFAPKQTGSGFWGGVFLGLSLGLIWTPCVGPIIASVITLAATSAVTLQSVFITLAYSAGTAIPMFGIVVGGRALLQRVPGLASNSGKIQKVFGILMIMTALGIYLNIDRRFQTFILDTFPNYGTGLTQIEQNDVVRNALDGLKSKPKSPTQTNDSSLFNVNMPYKAPDFIAGGSWINSDPLAISELKGKVVLVDFWTYTCINCIRTFPYLKDWYSKYKDEGFVIVGVHTPEFAFEHTLANVTKAVKDFGLSYPIMQDNDYATWESYDNHYWPAEYLIDKDGNVRRTHFGEGKYDETEKAIQALLKESGKSADMPLSDIVEQTPKARISPETYLGASRMAYYYPTQNTGVTNFVFTLPGDIPLNAFSFGGKWNIGQESATADNGSELVYRFFANKVFLVMKPNSGQGTVTVYLDDKLVGSAGGQDVQNGVVTIDSDRLYDLIDLGGVPGEHTLKLHFNGSGIEAFAFTFG